MDRIIRIGVFANPHRLGNGASIMTEGNLPFKMEYEVPAGISDNIFSFSFRRADQYTLFMMYCNSANIRTMDGFNGVLNIGVSINKGYTLSGGKSVYDLFMGVFDKLKQDYMSEGKGVYGQVMFSFKGAMNPLPQSYFDDVLEDYPVKESRSVYTPMTGSSSAGIELSEERIRALFRNVDYYINRHFFRYSEVIVAPKLDSDFPWNRINLPVRQVTLVPANDSYGIIAYYYDENTKPHYLSGAAGSPELVVKEQDFDRQIIVTTNSNERCYERGQVSFTVNNVLSQSEDGIKIDGAAYEPFGEKIVCTLKDKPKTKTFAIDLQTPDSPADLRNSIRLTLDDQPIAIKDGQFTLTGMQIASTERIQAKCEHDIYDINGNPSLSDGSFRVSLKYKTGNSGQSISSVSEPQANGKIRTDLLLKIEGKKFCKGDIVVVTARCGNQSVSKTVNNLQENNRIVVLPLLPDFVGSDEEITISVSYGSEKWEKTYKAKDFINQSVKFNVSKAKYVADKRSKGGKILGKIIFWSAPILLILLLATGVFAFLQWKEIGKLKDQYESVIQNYTDEPQGKAMSVEEPTIQESTVPAVTVKTLTDEQKLNFKKAKDVLQNDKLSFQEVNDLYELYSGLEEELKSQVDKDYREAVNQIKAYHNVVDILQKGNADDIKKLDDDNENMKLLNEYHRNMVLGIYYGDYRKNPPDLYAEATMNLETEEKPNLLGKEGGVNFFITARDTKERQYKTFEDLKHLFDTRNLKKGERNDNS